MIALLSAPLALVDWVREHEDARIALIVLGMLCGGGR
jgi:hypothetical protein